jgi:hypothetical protein
MSSLHRFIPVLITLYTMAGCASAPAPIERDVDKAQPVDRPVHVTGSRIPVPAGEPTSNAAQQVVTQHDIALTGLTNLGAALRFLVPPLQ